MSAPPKLPPPRELEDPAILARALEAIPWAGPPSLPFGLRLGAVADEVRSLVPDVDLGHNLVATRVLGTGAWPERVTIAVGCGPREGGQRVRSWSEPDAPATSINVRFGGATTDAISACEHLFVRWVETVRAALGEPTEIDGSRRPRALNADKRLVWYWRTPDATWSILLGPGSQGAVVSLEILTLADSPLHR